VLNVAWLAAAGCPALAALDQPTSLSLPGRGLAAGLMAARDWDGFGGAGAAATTLAVGLVNEPPLATAPSAAGSGAAAGGAPGFSRAPVVDRLTAGFGKGNAAGVLMVWVMPCAFPEGGAAGVG